MTLESKIEAILFWKGEPVTVKNLASHLEAETMAVEDAIASLGESLKSRGLAIVKNGNEVMLYSSPEASDLIKKLTKEELTQEVSKAGVEVLSLIIYKGPISKRDIDYIRGVNSSYIIRNLMVRGLVERADGRDARSFVYQPTFELLSHLGVSRKEDLSNFEEVQKDLAAFVNQEKAASEEEK